MIFPAQKNYAYLCDQFLELGKAVGKEAQAKAIIAESKERVTAIRARTAELAKPKVFIEIGAKPLFTANKDYFINDFVELAGGVNIAQDAKVGTYSREEVLRKNADLIIIVMMGLAVKKETEVWQKFKDLNAVRDNRIYIIDSRKVCSPTPVTFVETLNEIASLLHPELSRGKQ
jgi:iron complex transport system substrate-binding protein